MKNPDYILFSCLVQSEGCVTGVIGRAVAFPVKKFGPGDYLLATCSHAITPHLEKRMPIELMYADGARVAQGKPIGNNIIPAAFNNDLSFMRVELDRELTPVRLKTGRIKPSSRLCHVRNVSYRPDDFPDQVSVLTSTETKMDKDKRVWINGMFYKLTPELKVQPGRLPVAAHRAISMRSHPGVSGSPLWDRFGNVHGMVSGGTEQLTEAEPEYALIYLPAAEIAGWQKKF